MVLLFRKFFRPRKIEAILAPVRRVRHKLAAHAAHHADEFTKKSHKIAEMTDEVRDHQDAIRETRRIHANLAALMGE